MAKDAGNMAIMMGMGGGRKGSPPPTFPKSAPPENPETEAPEESDETDERIVPERAGLVAPGAQCGGCEHFDGQGACAKVAGQIAPDQVCYSFYEAKDEAMAEGAIPAPREEPE